MEHVPPITWRSSATGLEPASSEAERLLAELISESKRQYVSPYYFAVVYVGLGESDRAIDQLEKAFADRSNGLVFLKVEPELDSLRSNPRFLALQQKLHFPS